ncbi:hypothetical protein [Pedobacter faecalis]|uniref:hypothetical protein n=1 Tax=Pedobacter faecalis TaxID=3041495 RepID=UPI00254CECCD|nr:hypothetical protein [Pedobacter sp. ELA7]
MGLMKLAFALLIALDLLVISLAVFVGKPLLILLAIIGCAALRWLHNEQQIRYKLRQYHQKRLKNYYDNYK